MLVVVVVVVGGNLVGCKSSHWLILQSKPKRENEIEIEIERETRLER